MTRGDCTTSIQEFAEDLILPSSRRTDSTDSSQALRQYTTVTNQAVGCRGGGGLSVRPPTTVVNYHNRCLSVHAHGDRQDRQGVRQ